MTQAIVIIPHYNDTVRLNRCLTELAPQLSAHVSAIVVDNGSTEPMDDIIRSFPTIQFVTEDQKGAAAARNRGVLETDAPYIYFLDADCVPSDNWVETANALVNTADMVGGEVNIFHETDGALSGAQAFEAVFAFEIEKYIDQKQFTVTANLITSRKIFEAVGPFRPGVSEDLDWCVRARDAGYKLVFAETLLVTHPSRNDWPALRKKWLRMTEEAYGLVEKTTAGRLKWAARGLAMIPSIIVHIPKVLMSKNLDNIPDRLAGVSMLTQLRLLRLYWMLRQAMGLKVT